MLRLRGPEGHTLAALTALAIVEWVQTGRTASGFQIPGKAFGPDFILEIPGSSASMIDPKRRHCRDLLTAQRRPGPVAMAPCDLAALFAP